MVPKFGKGFQSRRGENRFSVRSVLTIFAVALVVILSTALVAPLFIDWSAHRAEIEARLGAMTSANIALAGPITVRLLPTPYLELGAGSISGGGQNAPRLSFEVGAIGTRAGEACERRDPLCRN